MSDTRRTHFCHLTANVVSSRNISVTRRNQTRYAFEREGTSFVGKVRVSLGYRYVSKDSNEVLVGWSICSPRDAFSKVAARQKIELRIDNCPLRLVIPADVRPWDFIGSYFNEHYSELQYVPSSYERVNLPLSYRKSESKNEVASE